jgi:hypothetical protein
MVDGEEQPIRIFLFIPVFSDLCVVVRFRAAGGLQQHCVASKTPKSFCKVDEFECTDLSSWFDNMVHTPKLLPMHSKNSGHDIPC